MAGLLSACSLLSPVALVLRPEWVWPDVLQQASYARGCAFQTLLLRTDGCEGDILARMRPSTRRRVWRGIRAGLQFTEDRSAIDSFYPIYSSSMRDVGSPDFALFEEHASLLRLPAVRLFLALLGDEIAAGSLCFENEDSIEARYVATNKEHRQIGPLNFLHYRAIQYAANAGKRYLDLSGIATGELDEKLTSINRFKLGFGGSIKEFPIFFRGHASSATDSDQGGRG